MSKSDWGRRTGRTADTKRQADYDALSEEKKAESALYVKEGRLVGSTTPVTIPKEFKPLLKFKFYCVHCGDYHTHSAGPAFCEKNPDRQKAVDNAKTKASHYYYNKGRKFDIAHGNNIHKERLRKLHKDHQASRSKEAKAVHYAKISELAKKRGFTPETREKARQGRINQALEKVNVDKAIAREGLVAPVFNFFETLKPKLDQEGFQMTDDEPKRGNFDSFTGRAYDSDGDFDPFG